MISEHLKRSVADQYKHAGLYRHTKYDYVKNIKVISQRKEVRRRNLKLIWRRGTEVTNDTDSNHAAHPAILIESLNKLLNVVI